MKGNSDSVEIDKRPGQWSNIEVNGTVYIYILQWNCGS